MATETTVELSGAQLQRETEKPPRYWPGVVILAAYWAFQFTCRQLELSMLVLFLSRFAVLLLAVLCFSIWWLTNRRISRRERWLAVAVTLAGAALAIPLSAIGPGLLIVGLPWSLTAGLAWLLVSKKATPNLRRWGLWATICLVWGFCTLLRWEGLSGDQQTEWKWRWEPTAEELFLRERNRAAQETLPTSTATGGELADGDWPQFRGLHRDGRVAEGKWNPDWQASPPRLVWKKRVGPAWSSLIVVGGRLYTQEQRGQMEAVVCYEASSGRELWVSEEQGRFEESVSGPGPRATPTFAQGKIYAAGGGGKLSCLDAVSGQTVWTRDLLADTGASPPQWGYSASPLVIDGFVVTFAGGPADHGLLAYRAETGEPAWRVATGKVSYCSPQLALLDGTKQILFPSDRGVVGVEPATGNVLWEFSLEKELTQPTIQPHVVGDTKVLIPAGQGLSLIEVRRRNDVWSAERLWKSRALRPAFNDVVLHQNTIYGFDEGIFCCTNLQTGARNWKDGRYGYGQVLLLTDSSLLLVLTEKGQLVLLETNSEEHKERGRFQAIEGKTWNHPVIAHGWLYLRNSEEMACYEFGSASSSEPRP